MRTLHDPGLRAVERVRGVREQDSRLGLQRALRDLAEREAALDRLEESIRTFGGAASGDMAQFAAIRQSLLELRHAVAAARDAVGAARSVAVDAHAHWSTDKSRLGAVEGLLERRAEERAVEAGRTEAKQLDDIAGQGWLRRARAEAEEG
ncbi:hypothetical protein GCM10022215_07830 [Nocardioides fonticola]|uniref:Flagellar FliJ protein n=1 Tax=Nocardioides fonticola TaxID=450363 RepID=A0ABP7XCS5_9ACTN